MTKGSREQNIRRIIVMEDRIVLCRRCKPAIRCVRRPSMGKGDLEPELLMVFEAENTFTKDLNKIIQLRNQFKKEFQLERIYHTFMVRCQPKACTFRESAGCYGEGKLLDKDYNCLLSGSKCEGILVRPGNEEIISCLPFLLEEIEILTPRYVLLFGQRVTEFVLRSYGIFADAKPGSCYSYDDIQFLITVNENQFDSNLCSELAGLAK